MHVLKRLAGVLAILLGGVGVLACLAGFVGIWVVHARTSTMIGNVTERVDVALSTLEERGRHANERIEDIRNSARLLDERVQQRVAELRDIPTEEAPDIDEIERAATEGLAPPSPEEPVAKEPEPDPAEEEAPEAIEEAPEAVSYTHLTLPTTRQRCRSRWSA